MTRLLMSAADRMCDGRVLMVHEGGYSEAHVPFCGHAVLQEMSGSAIDAPDPLANALEIRQPNARMRAHYSDYLTELVGYFGLT